MKKCELSPIQKAYRAFFLSMLEEFAVKSQANLDYQKKREFFIRIKEGWKQIKREGTKTPSKPSKYSHSSTAKPSSVSEPTLVSQPASSKFTRPSYPTKPLTTSITEKELIHSNPNLEQTDDLKIKYSPNQLYRQEIKYKYPVVKMPIEGSNIKLPRNGRSNQKGYKENDFYKLIKSRIPCIGVNNELHMAIPFCNRPYEPDIVLIDTNLNLYIDIEIDEPYDGYYRFPTHEEGKDDTRDLFFTESGWIVIRFTERQIHEQENECINFIENVLNSIYNNSENKKSNLVGELQWDYQQSIRWEKAYYREKYLGIVKFGKQLSKREVWVGPEEIDPIESAISRTVKFKFEINANRVSFDEEAHIYRHPMDETGNAEYISATTLIERFFPFDLEHYIKGKAKNENRLEKDVLEEFIKNRDEAAEKGTYLHQQIEKFLIGEKYDGELKEFKLFQEFYNNIIVKNDFEFIEAEKRIVFDRFNLAGTIDALFKKQNSEEYIILDWKRSKKLVVDGNPKKYGYGYALSELSGLDNSSYYKYSLQQNLYRYILENEYGYYISSMKLVVLHENYKNYYIISLDKMNKEINIILNSINHKI